MTTQTSTNHADFPDRLKSGYRAFATGRLPNQKDRFHELSVHGQKPPVLLISCCDSRVAPEVLFDAGPGELFVVRNVANLVPPYEAATKSDASETAAAIEYAVIALKVAHIVVMGHAQCGGIRAFALDAADKFTPLSEANFVARWKALVAPAAEKLGPATDDVDHYCEDLCHASISQGLANLRTYPWLKEREDAGELTLHGAYFGVADGQMLTLDSSGTFSPIKTG